MIYGLYAIRDAKSGYLSVTMDTNDYTARRNFENACNRSGSLFASHPSDFDFYRVGSFDTDSGNIEPVQPPQFLMSAPVTTKGE